MSRPKLSVALSLLAIAIALPGTSLAREAGHYGMADSHRVWRDSGYWHDHYPGWVYRYHPEWVVDEPDWWQADHYAHPEWFDYPFWHEYPIWQYGAYDQYHVWRYADWWHARNPEWVYLHHPEWAGAHAEWLRMDHGAHPDWFRSGYWHDHPHDWDHPDSFYRHYALEAGPRGGYHEGNDHRNDQRYGRDDNSRYEHGSNERGRAGNEAYSHPGNEAYSRNDKGRSPFTPGSRADANAYSYRTATAYRSSMTSGFHGGSSGFNPGGAFHSSGGGGKHR